ncbi:DNA-3-methyladenine glycosylase [Nocardioides dongxiaopingii]|uniref:DNA-3-methyladenine glycosylase n=1 Tax=Nocardioides sp. S-1144 TaxID=2582905 RepID=UPI00110F2E45|nr:DNA-3-methyladenine glycosylase [Nocardioides sp. S-1144]QCW50900.1 DNA-3-methyladenine glycosylase [Nocardioides sp. S-1144]
MSDWPELLGAAEDVAPRLLGAVLRLGEVAVRLTEVEAYAGTADPGSHASRGPTLRTRIMFGPAGSLYCYLSYGMHVCANVVVGEEGTAAAVLLRAGEVVAGHEVVAGRRPGVAPRDQARGPALLCRTLGIGLAHGGGDLRRGPVTLETGEPPARYERGPRTGLRLAPDRPWRFWLPGEPSVSAYRRHPKAVAEPGTTRF